MTTKIIKASAGQGPPGLSAYAIALDEGFVGTLQEWIDSLKGKSAYEVALDNGFVGTQQQWLESLKAESITYTENDAGKVLSNNGQTLEWLDLSTVIESQGVTIDPGEF